MIYVCLDANILLNTLKGNYHPDNFIRFLEDISGLENVEIVIQEQVKREWDRNKLTVYEETKKRLENVIREIDTVKYFSDTATFNELIKILQPKTKNLGEIVTENLNGLFTRIEKLIDVVKLLECDKDLLFNISKQAMEKEGHFFDTDKNNFGDAVIIKHIVAEYNLNVDVDELYFITENYKDFSVSKQQKEDLHQDIIDEIVPNKLNNFKYYYNVTKFIYDFSIKFNIKQYSHEEELQIKERIAWREKLIAWEIDIPNDRLDCPNCKHVLDDKNDGRWGHCMYGGGLTWHRICPNCKLEWDSGEYFNY